MSILTRYLTRQFLSRFLGVLGGLTLFVLMLEAAVFGAEIIASRDGESWVLLRYLYLRAPGVLATYYALSALIAALLMFVEISRHRELVAIWNTGQSPWQITRCLLPVALFLGLLNFANDNLVVPGASKQLTEWGVGIFGISSSGKKDDANQRHWFVVDDKVFAAKSISKNFHAMTDVMMFQRDAQGRVLNVVDAPHLTINGDEWKFHKPKIYQTGEAKPTDLNQAVFKINFDPAILPLTALPVGELSIARLYELWTAKSFGLAPKYLILTWIHKRLTSLVTGVISIFLAIAIAHGFAKARGTGRMFFIGIVFGFIYFVFDAIAISTGETGLVNPLLAGWFAPVFLIAAATWILLRFEVQRRES